MAARTTSPSNRIATLDGLRGISVVLVLIGHAFGTGLPVWSPRLHAVSELGVRMFFVISGFLITTLLVNEHDQSGDISLRRFYFRRTLRIFPAFYCYLAFVGAISLAGLTDVHPTDLVQAGTYTMNLRAERPWLVGHIWSLSVEEQFYLLWPLVLMLSGQLRARRIAIGAVFVVPALRVACWYRVPGLRPYADQALPFICDSLAIGCALALGRHELERSNRYCAFLQSWWFWPTVTLLVATSLFSSPWFDFGLGMTATNLGLALVLHRCMLLVYSLPSQALMRPGLVWVGTISYSLYLWQQPFMDRHHHAWFTQFPINIVLAIAVAAVFHRLVEVPMQLIRNAYQPAARQT